MGYNKNSFLAGIAVGRRLHGAIGGWGPPTGGGGGTSDWDNPGYVLEYTGGLIVGDMGYGYDMNGAVLAPMDGLIVGEYIEGES